MPRESQLKKSKIQPPRTPPPPIQKQTETPKIGLLDTFVQGFGWGLGTSVSGKIVDKIFSSDENLDKNNSHLPNSTNLPKNDSLLNNVTEDLYKKYQDCLENNSNKDSCYSIIKNSKIE
jgi:hypothetical protein